MSTGEDSGRVDTAEAISGDATTADGAASAWEDLPDVDDVVAPGDDTLKAGTRVGEYEVQEKVGEGGFGTVYRAVQPMIGKEVAIKVLKRELSSNRDIVSRFLSEARSVNQIGHRHIVDVFSFGTLRDGRQYSVMTYLRGESLAARLAHSPGRRLSFADARPVLRAVAEALAAAHAAGIAHRDLKPANVFLVDDGDVKLLDFGVAKLMSGEADHRTETGAPIGTPHYMSPQQARGQPVDHRTDVYSFGVMAYQILTGVLPFPGDSFVDIAMKHVSEAARPPSELLPELPPAADDALLAMLAKDPAGRPAGAPEALAELEAAMGAVDPAGVVTPSATGRRGPRLAVASAAEAAATVPSNDGAPAPAAARRRAPRAAVVAAGMVAVAIAAAVWLVNRDSAVSRAPKRAATATGAAAGGRPAYPAPATPARAPASAVPAPAPAVAPTATIRLALSPAEAVVTLDGVLVHERELVLPRSEDEHTLVVAAEGFEPQTRSFRAVADGSIEIALHGAPAHGRPAPRARVEPTPAPVAPPAAAPVENKPARGSRNSDL